MDALNVRWRFVLASAMGEGFAEESTVRFPLDRRVGAFRKLGFRLRTASVHASM